MTPPPSKTHRINSSCVTLRASAISRGGVTTTINASTLKDKDYEEINRRFRNRVRRRHRLRRDERVEFTAGEGGHVLHCFYLRLTRMRRLMSNRTGLSSSLRRSTRGTSETFDPVF